MPEVEQMASSATVHAEDVVTPRVLDDPATAALQANELLGEMERIRAGRRVAILKPTSSPAVQRGTRRRSHTVSVRLV